MSGKRNPETDSLEKKNDDKRGHWRNPVEFLLSTLGYAIGMGSLWRFPYLAMRNGGGAFLVPYMIFAAVFGLPLFFMESSLGQYFQRSPVRVFDICPLLKGIGIVMCLVSTLTTVYYVVLLAWTLYFIYNAFSQTLPWTTCNNPWNTPLCQPLNAESNSTFNVSGLAIGKPVLATEEFWENRVLSISSGIHEMGTVQWHLALCLLIAWACVFLCIFKGIDSSRYAVYITATVPLILLVVLCAWTATFPGAKDGMLLYITPRWENMKKYQVWIEAFLQVFNSLGPGWGGLITLSSYNPFRHNVLRDALLVTLADTMTAIFCGFVIFSGLGYMAHQTGVPILEVVRTGPGLSFVTYPQVVSSMPVPQLWASLFFFTIFFLGIDSAFGMLKTFTSGLFDLYPNTLGRWKTLVTLGICIVSYIVGLIFVTQGGLYYFQIVDWYLCFFALVLVTLLECLVVSYLYGIDKFLSNIKEMLGDMNKGIMVLLKYSLMFTVPTVMAIALVFTMATFRSPTYGNYVYPQWTNVFGWILGCSMTLPIPVMMLYQILKNGGSLMERFRKSVQPVILRKGDEIVDHNAESNQALLYRINTVETGPVDKETSFVKERNGKQPTDL